MKCLFTVPRFGHPHHSKINKLDGIIIIITDLVLSNKKQLNPFSPAWYFRNWADGLQQ